MRRPPRPLSDRRPRRAHITADQLATFSHELRTPLNGVLGMARLLEGTQLSAEQRAYAIALRESGQHLLNVITDILDMSKIEAGHMRISCDAIDLAPLIEETLRLTAISAKQKDIRVDQQVSSGLSLIADRRAMKQILLNLLSNAMKFTNSGGQVHVRAKKRGGAVTLTLIRPSCTGPIFARDARGWTRTSIVTPFTSSAITCYRGRALSRAWSPSRPR